MPESMDKNRCRRCNQQFPVVIASGDNMDALVEKVLRLLPTRIATSIASTNRTVLLAPPADRTNSLAAAIRTWQAFDSVREIEIVRAPRGLNVMNALSRQWIPVQSPVLSQRFDRILVPRELVGRTRLLMTSLNGSWALSPVTLTASFAHPRQRLAVRASGERGGSLELAAPLTPDVVVMTGRGTDGSVVIAANDLIAAEVVWLAWQSSDSGSETVVPWHDPVIQRAAELELGPIIPDQILFILEDGGGLVEAESDELLPRLRERLGIS